MSEQQPTPLPKSLYLLRHGQTHLNVRDVVRGCLDPGLDDTGHQQARLLANIFRNRGITRVICGPLKRSRQTAEYIARSSGVELQVREELRDRDYAQWAGCSRMSVNALFGSVDAAPGIEPYEAFSERVSAVMEDIIAETGPGEAVAVVGHKAVNRAIMASLFPKRFTQARNIPQDPGCWNLIGVNATGRKLLAVNALPFPSMEIVPHNRVVGI